MKKKVKTKLRVYRITTITMGYVLAINAYSPKYETHIIKAENKKKARKKVIGLLVERKIYDFRIEKVKRLWGVR